MCRWFASLSKEGKNGWPNSIEPGSIVRRKGKGRNDARPEPCIVVGFSADIEGKQNASAGTVWTSPMNNLDQTFKDQPYNIIVLDDATADEVYTTLVNFVFLCF